MQCSTCTDQVPFNYAGCASHPGQVQRKEREAFVHVNNHFFQEQVRGLGVRSGGINAFAQRHDLLSVPGHKPRRSHPIARLLAGALQKQGLARVGMSTKWNSLDACELSVDISHQACKPSQPHGQEYAEWADMSRNICSSFLDKLGVPLTKARIPICLCTVWPEFNSTHFPGLFLLIVQSHLQSNRAAFPKMVWSSGFAHLTRSQQSSECKV